MACGAYVIRRILVPTSPGYQNEPMQGLLTHDGHTVPASVERLEKLLAAESFFWLDYDGIGDESRDILLATFHLHHLAVEDAEQFGQRPKVEGYNSFTYMVVHGAGPDGKGTAEIHFIIAEHYVITIHRGECAALTNVRQRIGHPRPAELATPQIALLYLIIDQLVDSFFPFLDAFDTSLDELEDDILLKPTNAQLGTMFDMKRTLVGIRKVITPQRDMFASIISGVNVIPGVDDNGQHYMRDLYDHLIRISDLVDSYRDLLSGSLDTHLSTVSNKLNVVMKQLTIIATIFLPLSFLTGFFGQNFAWLVDHIHTGAAFVIFGIGLELLCAAVLLLYFRKKGWLGGDSAG
jgi:magnesium transporter